MNNGTRLMSKKALLVALASSLTVSGCTLSASVPATDAAAREAALAEARLMPDASTFSAENFEWRDVARNRMVPARLYLPGNITSAQRQIPLVVFSHGIGGSREGYKYLGRNFAANGYASLHLQHVGSDRQIWVGNPFGLLSRLSGAAQDSEAIDRVQDLTFALDQLLESPLGAQMDISRIIAAGHSYGANTSMLAAGATVKRDGKLIALRDARISAAILLSAPPFYGTGDAKGILGSIDVPTLHITATDDDISIPGYRSGVADRVAIFQATGTARPDAERAGKTLAVFRGGSHSVFTDRFGTGGMELNPKIKAATRDLTLAFLRSLDVKGSAAEAGADGLLAWQQMYAPLLANFERVGRFGRAAPSPMPLN